MTDPADRRRFLQPRGLFSSLDQWTQSLDEGIEQLDRALSEPYVTLRREAMACHFEIQFGILETNRKAAKEALLLIDDLEHQLSVYRDDSEVSLLNVRAAGGPVAVEARLFSLLVRCQQYFETLQGAFDVTAGPLIRSWGFRRREGRLPEGDEIAEVMATVGMKHVQLDAQAQTVRFSQPGIEINLGAIGKGYALDRAGELLRSQGFSAALLSAGRSSLLAIDRPSWDDAWQVDLLDPTKVSTPIARVRLHGAALSTSGVTEQYFEQEGTRYSHLIDPRSGWPAQGMLQVTAQAPDATYAEALSTAFFVQGRAWTEYFCRRHPEVGALIIPDPGPNRPLRPILCGKIDAELAAPTRDQEIH